MTFICTEQELAETDFEGIPEADINEIVYERAKRLYRVGE